MTKKLYDLDSHRRDFTAAVLRCDADGERYAVVLDQTLFFPEGGGQPADTGVLGGAGTLRRAYHLGAHPQRIRP